MHGLEGSFWLYLVEKEITRRRPRLHTYSVVDAICGELLLENLPCNREIYREFSTIFGS